MCERNFLYILHASMYMLCENFAINLLTWENSRITSVFIFHISIKHIPIYIIKRADYFIEIFGEKPRQKFTTCFTLNAP